MSDDCASKSLSSGCSESDSSGRSTTPLISLTSDSWNDSESSSQISTLSDSKYLKLEDQSQECKSLRKETTTLDQIKEITLPGGAIMRIYKEVSYVCEGCGKRSTDFHKMKLHIMNKELFEYAQFSN